MTNIQNTLLKKISWLMLKQSAFDVSERLEVYNKTYQHWKQTWIEILDVKESLTSDSFMRQSYICPMLYENKVIGMIACSFFSAQADASYDHSYLRAFSTDVVRQMCGDARVFMTIEYLSVCEEFRKSVVGISLGDVLLGLSMKVFESSTAGCVLGTARVQINVNKMCHNFGFQPVGMMNKFGHPCELIINTKKTLAAHSDPQVNDVVQSLWASGEIKDPVFNYTLVS